MSSFFEGTEGLVRILGLRNNLISGQIQGRRNGRMARREPARPVSKLVRSEFLMKNFRAIFRALVQTREK